MADPSFRIPVRPRRSYPYSGGVEYEGKTVFRLVPDADRSEDTLLEYLADILDDGQYRYGDFYNLPMPVYLVRDEKTGDVFRVSIRDGTLGLHVLPETESAGLTSLYERLDERTDVSWRVERESTETTSSD